MLPQLDSATLDLVSIQENILEYGIGRHPIEDNIYVYFWEPDCNRFELCSKMYITTTDQVNYFKGDGSIMAAWGTNPPESFSGDLGSFMKDNPLKEINQIETYIIYGIKFISARYI